MLTLTSRSVENHQDKRPNLNKPNANIIFEIIQRLDGNILFKFVLVLNHHSSRDALYSICI